MLGALNQARNRSISCWRRSAAGAMKWTVNVRPMGLPETTCIGPHRSSRKRPTVMPGAGMGNSQRCHRCRRSSVRGVVWLMTESAVTAAMPGAFLPGGWGCPAMYLAMARRTAWGLGNSPSMLLLATADCEILDGGLVGCRRFQACCSVDELLQPAAGLGQGLGDGRVVPPEQRPVVEFVDVGGPPWPADTAPVWIHVRCSSLWARLHHSAAGAISWVMGLVHTLAISIPRCPFTFRVALVWSCPVSILNRRASCRGPECSAAGRRGRKT